jgi:hypothetical protein
MSSDTDSDDSSSSSHSDRRSTASGNLRNQEEPSKEDSRGPVANYDEGKEKTPPGVE